MSGDPKLVGVMEENSLRWSERLPISHPTLIRYDVLGRIPVSCTSHAAFYPIRDLRLVSNLPNPKIKRGAHNTRSQNRIETGNPLPPAAKIRSPGVPPKPIQLLID